MWGALIKQIFAYLLTRRGKKALAFVGTMSLWVTAVLVFPAYPTSSVRRGA
jgi:hypothetical protein